MSEIFFTRQLLPHFLATVIRSVIRSRELVMLVEDKPDTRRVEPVWIDEGRTGMKFHSAINI